MGHPASLPCARVVNVGALRLLWSHANRAKEALKQVLPDSLRDGSFSNDLKSDPTTKKWLTSLLTSLSATGEAGATT